MKVLIVEDEGIIAWDLESMVLDNGFEVAGLARTEIEAIALARRADIALVDVQLADGPTGPQIARTLIDLFGEKRVHWAMMAVSLIVGLPVFWEVGFVLLVPIVFTVAKRTGTSIIKAGLPMATGLSVVHAPVPPHPAATMAGGE